MKRSFSHLCAGALAGCAALAMTAAPASANPDIWVESEFAYLTSDSGLEGLRIAWFFDRYFSNRTSADFDADKDGAFSVEEAARLEKEAFEPLAAHSYHLHVLQDGAPQPFAVTDFTPAIEEESLVYRFEVQFEEPLDYHATPVAFSQQDPEVVIDFAFREGQFITIDGPFDPACKVRIGPGRGPLKGHPRVVTLTCGD